MHKGFLFQHLTVNSMKKITNHSLYLVLSEEYGRNRNALDIAQCAIAGGVDIIQMREKKKNKQELIRLGQTLAQLCRKHNSIFIVNDDPLLAQKIDADGVHLGQEDLQRFPIKETRHIIGSDKIIGLSVSTVAEVNQANRLDIDYMAFGPVFPTTVVGSWSVATYLPTIVGSIPLKRDCHTIKKLCVGIKDVKKVIELSQKPLFFIGGINLSNLTELLACGARNIAVIRAILGADDITAAVHEFKIKLGGTQNGKAT